MMGGMLTWMFVLQAIAVGSLFIGANYYLWQGMERMRGAERYQKYIKYMVFVLITCFIVWLTPHTIVMTPQELKAMGGQQHPVLGNYGVMSAKNGAINTIITTTVLSFIMYQRANKIPTVRWAPLGNAFLIGLFIMAYVNIAWLAIYGYYIPANVRVGLSVPQVASTLVRPSATNGNARARYAGFPNRSNRPRSSLRRSWRYPSRPAGGRRGAD